MLGNMAQCKYAAGELVAVTLRFTTHEHNGQVYQAGYSYPGGWYVGAGVSCNLFMW